MLESMASRGSIVAQSVISEPDCFLAIGYCSHPYEESRRIHPDKTSMVLDGTVPSSLEAETIGGQIDDRSISEGIDSGPLSILAISAGRLLASRDVMGQKPLYYGTSPQGIIGFASLKTALAKIGIQNSMPVPPGQVIAASKEGTSVLADKSLRRPRETRISEKDASRRLEQFLVESLGGEVPSDLGLAFSGGLDSALVAKAAKENDLRPELITVGMKGQAELKHAREVANHLDLDLTVRELSQSEVLESLQTVVSIVESTDPILVSVSVPLFFACELAEEIGADCLLAGQLSDELFAGYGRFDELAKKRNLRQARDEVWRSVLAASTIDFEPGDKLAVSHRLELGCPFAFPPLVQFALRIPISLKLKIVGSAVVRKYILRRVASDWKLPESVVNRPKKAIQYSSGVQKILAKEAKRRHTTVAQLLESLP